MQQQLNINMKRLWELAKQGRPARELMEELGIAEMATMKSALQDLMREKSETVNVPGLIGDSSFEERFTSEGIRIPSEMLAGMGLHEGERFRLKVEGNRITIERTEVESLTEEATEGLTR